MIMKAKNQKKIAILIDIPIFDKDMDIVNELSLFDVSDYFFETSNGKSFLISSKRNNKIAQASLLNTKRYVANQILNLNNNYRDLCIEIENICMVDKTIEFTILVCHPLYGIIDIQNPIPISSMEISMSNVIEYNKSNDPSMKNLLFYEDVLNDSIINVWNLDALVSQKAFDLILVSSDYMKPSLLLSTKNSLMLTNSVSKHTNYPMFMSRLRIFCSNSNNEFKGLIDEGNIFDLRKESTILKKVIKNSIESLVLYLRANEKTFTSEDMSKFIKNRNDIEVFKGLVMLSTKKTISNPFVVDSFDTFKLGYNKQENFYNIVQYLRIKDVDHFDSKEQQVIVSYVQQGRIMVSDNHKNRIFITEPIQKFYHLNQSTKKYDIDLERFEILNESDSNTIDSKIGFLNEFIGTFDLENVSIVLPLSDEMFSALCEYRTIVYDTLLSIWLKKIKGDLSQIPNFESQGTAFINDFDININVYVENIKGCYMDVEILDINEIEAIGGQFEQSNIEFKIKNNPKKKQNMFKKFLKREKAIYMNRELMRKTMKIEFSFKLGTFIKMWEYGMDMIISSTYKCKAIENTKNDHSYLYDDYVIFYPKNMEDNYDVDFTLFVNPNHRLLDE